MSPHALSAKRLEAQCSQRVSVVVHDAIDSTSSWLMRQVRDGVTLPLACFAEVQTQGRGRRGKDWLMPRNNIAMSLAYPLALSHGELSRLPLAIAVAIASLLRGFGVKNVQIKWPNDVLVGGRKIAGILLETTTAGPGGLVVVAGIGLNYDAAELHQATSLQQVAWTDFVTACDESGVSETARPGRGELATALLDQCLDICQGYPENAGVFMQHFNEKYNYCLGRQVDILLDDGRTLTGEVTGLTGEAALVVQVDGRQQVFHSGDVSIRPAQ